MLRRIGFAVLLVLALLSVAAAAPDTTAVAVNIVTVLLMLVVPFLPLAQIKVSGPTMVAISFGLALAITIVAALITGDLKSTDLQSGTLVILGKAGALWSVSQIVFQTLKDHPVVGPLLTTKPLLTAPAPPAVVPGP